jgi:hypothetical protein
MATLKKFKQGSRIGAKGERTSRRREIQKWANGTVALIGAVSPWLIYWLSGGK